MTTSEIEYYGPPEPIETLSSDSFFFNVAMAAHRRFSALPAYESAIRHHPAGAGRQASRKRLPPQQT